VLELSSNSPEEFVVVTDLPSEITTRCNPVPPVVTLPLIRIGLKTEGKIDFFPDSAAKILPPNPAIPVVVSPIVLINSLLLNIFILILGLS
jgi:hypothetical protein